MVVFQRISKSPNQQISNYQINKSPDQQIAKSTHLCTFTILFDMFHQLAAACFTAILSPVFSISTGFCSDEDDFLTRQHERFERWRRFFKSPSRFAWHSGIEMHEKGPLLEGLERRDSMLFYQFNSRSFTCVSCKYTGSRCIALRIPVLRCKK